MALMRRGSLFAGALYSGLLFGPRQVEAAAQQIYGNGGKKKRLRDDADPQHVRDSWEWLEETWERQKSPDPRELVHVVPVQVPASLDAAADLPISLDAAVLVHAPVAIDAMAEKRLRRRHEEALILMAIMADDDD